MPPLGIRRLFLIWILDVGRPRLPVIKNLTPGASIISELMTNARSASPSKSTPNKFLIRARKKWQKNRNSSWSNHRPPPRRHRLRAWQNRLDLVAIHHGRIRHCRLWRSRNALQICSAADRAAEYAAAIDHDGPMIATKHGPKEHPLLKHELAARSFVVRGLQRLGLNVEAVKPIGRPAGKYGWPDAN